MPRRVFIVAGEASGDAQAAKLAAAMLALDPSVVLSGVGGPAMRAAGVEIEIDVGELSIMGISEVSSGLARVWKYYRQLKARLLSARAPDLLILVDFPDFNLRLARAAKKAGVRVFYYVSPQVWAWRRGRIRSICRWVDRMVVLFPFEAALYRAHGLDVHFVGHPLAEDVGPTLSPEQTRAKHGIAPDLPLVALLPGSRNKEVAAVLPQMLGAAREIGARARFVIASAPGLDPARAQEMVRSSGVDVAIVRDDTYNLVSASHAVLVTSGTATVECAIMGVPMVVIYRMSRLSYAIAKRLVKVPFIAMPNIVLGRRAVPELIQAEAVASKIAAELARYLDCPDYRAATVAALAGVHDVLVQPGAARRAAALALEMMP